jgi:hypothetical protein
MNKVRKCCVFAGNIKFGLLEDEKKETLVKFMRSTCNRYEFANAMREVQEVVGYLQFRSRLILA